jgi:protein-S-isoprenylcysteine O-methyltransferase Ste14
MYAGALLMLLATPIALGSWWGLIAFVPMLASIVWRLLAEEELLAHQLSGYADYRARVRYRLLPLLW